MEISRYFHSKRGNSKGSNSSRMNKTVPVALLTALLSFLPGHLAYAQADSRNGGPVADVSERAIAQSHTPKQVLDGTARLIDRLAPATTVHLVLGLTPPKLAEEEAFLKQLQDPKSPNFHKYLTAAQWNARFAPSVADEQKVADWAETNGLKVTGRFPNRLVIDVDATSENVEKAFAVKMNSYQLAGRTEISNDRDPVMPAQVAGILHSVSGLNTIQQLRTPRGGTADMANSHYARGAQVVSPTSTHADGNKAAFDQALQANEEAKRSFPTLKATKPELGQQPQVTSGLIDPTDIYSSYGYSFGALQNQGHCCNPTNDGAGSTPNTSIAIATSGQIYGDDILAFHNRYSYLAYNYTTINIDGNYTCDNSKGNDDSCVETALDTEWAIATANSFGSYLATSHVYIYQAVNAGLGTFTDMFNQILSDGHARVFSTSWGCGEYDCYDSGTMDTDHGIFNSMLGQGWTLLGSSGDNGAAQGCFTHDRVNYPASDPDLIAVGGTSLSLYNDGTFASETGWQGGTYAGACKHNDGGSGGGCSTKFAAPGYQTDPFCGTSGRSVPDISLNAGNGQNVYYNGGWYGYGGTSIATPQVAGFIAQANAYLLALGSGPAGQANYMIYYLAHNPGYAQHQPFYDMTSGCNNNDITAANNLGYFCSVAGYDRVTGWGSFNALQLAWGINTYYKGDFVAPTVTFSGPAGVSPNYYTYFNTDQTVSWTVTDSGSSNLPATGVAGFTQAWDAPVSDPTSETTHGTGNAFYNGPQFPNATSGYLSLAAAGEGCHYATVDAWDNSGFTSGNQYFYWLCYDVTAPTTTAALSGTTASGYYAGPVKVTLTGTDNLSGVVKTVYQIDGGAVTTYTAPFTISTIGTHTVTFHSNDKAGNVESSKSITFKEKYATTSTLTASPTTAIKGSTVVFTAKVTSTSGTPTGNVSLKDGSTVLQTAALASGTVQFSVSTLAVGTHAMTIAYASDTTHASSSSAAVSVSIKNATTTALSSSGTIAYKGVKVTFTATVASSAGTPTGNVQFKDGSTVIGTVALASGKAAYSTTTLAVGTHSITAYYVSDATYYQSTSSAINEVIKNATMTALATSANPVVKGTKVTFTATVTSSAGTPTGSVQFKDGATVIATVALASGKAVYSTTTLAVGTHSMTANYTSDATYYQSTSGKLNEVVKTATTTALASSLNPATHGQSVTFTATVSAATGTPTGSVQFKDGTTVLGTATIASGKATYATTTLAVGTHSVTAVYGSDANYYNSTSSALSEVIK